MADGRSGLLHATTGSGKTYAVWFGALARAAALGVPLRGAHAPPLGVLWLTPMRALAADTTRALQRAARRCSAPTGRSACAPATRRRAERARRTGASRPRWSRRPNR